VLQFRILVCVIAGLALLATQADAQTNYPSRPVKIIVASAPGGGTDTIGRILAEQLSQSMRAQFYVENRPGGGNIVGTEAVARSPADGYTLLVTASTLTINHVTYKKLPYDAERDFAPITQVVSLPNVLVVDPVLPARSLADFIALAKKEPGKLTYGSAGVGTNPHMAMELLKSMAAIDVQHIPYRGVAPALTDILGGRISGMIVNMISAKPHVDAGTLRALAVSSLQRTPSLPDIPTIAEAGVPNYEALQWFGFLAPAGTPPDIVDQLQRETAKALQSDEVKTRLAADGAEPVGSTPEQLGALVKNEIEKWGKVARAAHIEPQ
jgi:tripartite-type tricarboxylate transporter receptor subunit TctC